MLRRIIILILLNVSLFGSIQNADDISFVDDITINGREFESLEQRTIEFYEEDLQNGKIVIQGLLESNDKNVDANDLFVEISKNGGKSWNRASGHKEWEYSFEPKLDFTYSFSLRVVRESSTLDNSIEFPNQFNISGFILTLNDNYKRIGDTIKGSGSIYVPWLESFGLNGNLDVNFENLSFEEDRITSGSIKYESALIIDYEDIKLDISKLVFNANNTKNSMLAKLSSTTNTLLSSLPNTDISSLSFDTKGIVGKIDYSNSFNFNIWEEQGVKVAFNSISLDFSLLMTTGLRVNVSDLNASLHFGNLLGSVQKTLAIKKDEFGKNINGIFQWSESTRKKLISDKNIFLSNSIGTLNLEDLSNPKIIFNSSIDLSQYSGLFTNMNTILAEDIMISKNGLSASFSTTLNPISIWDEQNVKLNFDGKIGIELELASSGLNVDINTGNMQLDFGNLFDSATAELTPIINEIGGMVSSRFSWTINEAKNLKSDASILLKELSGELDLSSLTKPIISFNASADLSAYGGLLEKIKSASITNAKISEDGLSASLGILIDSLDIWKEKGVKLYFSEDTLPTLNLSLSSSGDLNFGFDNLDANVDFGTLLPGTLATLESLQDGLMNLTFDNSKIIYLLEQKNKLTQLVASLDLSNLQSPKISFSSSLELSGYTGILSQIKNLNLTNALISKEGLSATATATLKDINIWEEKKVRLSFSKAPSFTLSISDKLDFSIGNLNASLHFGDLFDGATAQLNALRDDANNIVANTYSWGVNSGKKIVSDAKAVLDNLEGKLNLVDFENPNIIFNADVNLSQYGGTLAKINNAKISNAKISKKGLSAETSLEIEHIDIYKQKGVKLEFNSNPKLKFSFTTSGYKVGLSNLDASIDFGTLIPRASATIQRVLSNAEVQDTISTVEDINNEAQSFIEENSIYSWDVTGSYNLYGNEVSLSTLMGTIDFSDLSNPLVLLNANIAFNESSFLHSYAQNIELLNAKISKNGFSSQIQTQLSDIPIWSEKNVKLDFDENDIQKLSLSVLTSGFKLSLDEFNADLDFGTLIKDAKAEVQTLSSGVFTWNLENTQKSLLDTTIALKNLYGSLSLSDISNPIIDINGAINLSTYSSRFESIGDISLLDAKITKSSFETKLSAQLDDIMIYQEKQVKLVFNNGVSPTFALAVNREGIDFGVENISASIDFGQLLGGEILALNKKANSQISTLKSSFNNVRNLAKTRANEIQNKVSGLKKLPSVVKTIENFDGIYTWNLANSHNFLTDGNGSITVSNIGGEVNLKSLLNPIIDFHTTADFSAYTLEGFNFDALVEVEKATISRSGIEWNLSISNASTDFTVLDLGTKEQDVRVELFNINASTGSSGTEISSAAGTLFLGNKLFDGTVNPITLAYDGGKYTFSSTQTLTYTYQNTILKIVNPTGSIQKINGSYQVAFTGNAQFFTDILKNIGVSNIDLSGLKINSTGFKANLSTTFSPIQEHTLFGDKVKLSLTSIGIIIDSKANIPIKLSNIVGDVDLSVLFNEAENYAKTAIGFVDSNLTFDFGTKILHLGEGDRFEFKNLGGAFNIDSLDKLSMSINGNFGYKEWENLNLELSGFTISSKGVSGEVGLADGTKIATIIDNLDINELNVNFVDTTNVSGNIGMHYSKDGFLGSTNKLTFDMGAQVSLDGVDKFRLDTNALQEIPIENFANMTLSGVTSNLDMENFSLSFNGLLQPTHTLLSSLSAVEFDGLEISKNGISIDSISSTKAISGASFDLAGMTLTLKELGLGYKVSDELLFFKASGNLGLTIAEAGASMTFYSNGTYDINDIELDISQPAIILSGTFGWFENATYGKGFGLDNLNLGIAGIFNVEGAFKIGQKNSSRYWMAKALYSSSSGVPLTPIPISLYGLGGGAAYGMEIVRAEGSMESTFVPSGDDNIIISGLIKLGTNDVGYTWHGNLGFDIDLGSGTTSLNGISYLLSDLESTPEQRVITASVMLGTSPFEISIDGGIDVKYLASNFELVHLTGNGALAYTSASKYIRLGTKAEPIDSRIFDLASAQSYLVLENGIFAVGSKFESSKRYSKYGFGIGYDTEIGFDAEAGFGRKIYIDLQAYLDMAIEARIPIKGWFDLASVKGKVRFRTPNPTLFSLYLRGCAYKCASHTFYLIGKKPSSSDSSSVNILKDIEPYANNEISLSPIIKVGTFVPNDGTMVEVANKEYKFSIVNSKLVKTSDPSRNINYRNGRIDSQTIGFMPANLLSPNTEYRFTADVRWLSVNNVGTDVLERTDSVEKVFRTTSDNTLQFSEIVSKVYPQAGRKNVSAKSKVHVIFSPLVNLYSQSINNYTISVVDSKSNDVEGTWENMTSEINTGLFGESNSTSVAKKVFTPNELFTTYHFCLNNSTGEIKETVMRSDGKYYNPFREYTVDGENETNEENPDNVNTSTTQIQAVGTGSLSGMTVSRASGISILTASDLGITDESYTDLNLGEPSYSNDSYSYYSINRYMIKVKDNTNRVVFISTFEAKQTGSQGDQFVYLTNNLDDINPKIVVERGNVIADGQSSRHHAILTIFETKAANNEFPPCAADQGIGEHAASLGNTMSRTCATCGDCLEERALALKSLLLPSPTISKITVDSGINRQEYPNIYPYMDVVFEDELNPEITYEKSYRLLYGEQTDNLYQMRFEGIEKVKSATIRYYVADESDISNLILSNRIEPVSTKEVTIEDPKLEEVSRPEDESGVHGIGTPNTQQPTATQLYYQGGATLW